MLADFININNIWVFFRFFNDKDFSIVKRENYYKSEFFTECNILLYSVNNENKSFDNIKDFIFDFLLFQDEGKKQLFYLFALNNNSDKIIDSKNKIGKNIAEEIQKML